MGVAPPGQHGMSDKVRVYVVHLPPHVSRHRTLSSMLGGRAAARRPKKRACRTEAPNCSTREHTFFPRAPLDTCTQNSP